MITRTAFGMAAYFSMAVSATGLGVTGLAAHQVSMQVLGAGFILEGSVGCGLDRLIIQQEVLVIVCTWLDGCLRLAPVCEPHRSCPLIPQAPLNSTLTQIFWFLSYVPETLSLAAQSMIARDRRIPRAGQAWSRLLLGCGAALGVTLALALVAVFKRGLALFTTDLAVIAQVGAIWPMAAAALALCSCMMIMDGGFF